MNDKDFEGIVAGLTDAVAIAAGQADPAGHRVHVPATVDVRAMRKKLGLTQDRFAARFGFSVGAVRDWEQRRSQPEAVARVLLTVIDREPEAVQRALAVKEAGVS